MGGTAVTYINNMGGTKSCICNLIANEIWNWSIDRNIWLSAEHLPGSKNVLADEQSRAFDDTTEWMIHKCVFLELVKIFGSPAIDLFASRLKRQVTTFVSWKPDPMRCLLMPSVGLGRSLISMHSPHSVSPAAASTR